jgi:hypothetical protein
MAWRRLGIGSSVVEDTAFCRLTVTHVHGAGVWRWSAISTRRNLGISRLQGEALRAKDAKRDARRAQALIGTSS